MNTSNNTSVIIVDDISFTSSFNGATSSFSILAIILSSRVFFFGDFFEGDFFGEASFADDFFVFDDTSFLAVADDCFDDDQEDFFEEGDFFFAVSEGAFLELVFLSTTFSDDQEDDFLTGDFFEEGDFFGEDGVIKNKKLDTNRVCIMSSLQDPYNHKIYCFFVLLFFYKQNKLEKTIFSTFF